MIQAKTHRPAGSTKALALGLLLAVLVSLMLAAKPAHADKTFTVNDAGDFLDHNVGDGVCDFTISEGDRCSLRAAIQEANHPNSPGPDTIEFEIGGSGASGVKTIRPVAALPDITETVTIDGYSQPGSATNTFSKGTNAVLNIQLDGSTAGSSAEGLRIAADNVLVRGLAVNSFSRFGIRIDGNLNSVVGNFIGTSTSGTLGLGNGLGGVLVRGDSNAIGGSAPSQRNLVSGNEESGVNLNEGSQDNLVAGNLVFGNSIFSNAGLGINLVGGTESATGATRNDPGDADTGPNDLQNKPVITSATTSGDTTTITGKLNSTPNESFDLHFYSNPSGNEGKRFLVQGRVTTNANGNTPFTFSFSGSTAVAAGQTVTATATTDRELAGSSTSEFSAPRNVVAQ